MSETSTEKSVSKSSSKGSGLTKKVGPMPLWGWGATATVSAMLLFLYMKHKKSATTTASATGTASTSPSYAAVPAGGGNSGGYYYDGGGYPVQGVSGPTQANQNTASHPYLAVADIADVVQALEAGIPVDWLAYAGSDPMQNKAAQDPTYNPPNGLQSLGSLASGASVAYGGVAQQIADQNAPKVYGATRKGTLAAMQKWYQSAQQGNNQGYYVAQ